MRCSWLIIDYEHQRFSYGDDVDDHDEHNDNREDEGYDDDDSEYGGCVGGCSDTKVSRVELQDSRQGFLLVGLSFRIRNDDNTDDGCDDDGGSGNGGDDNSGDDDDDDGNDDNDNDDEGGNDTKVSGLLLAGLNF